MKNMRLILVAVATLPVLIACDLFASNPPTPPAVLILPATSAPTATKASTVAPAIATATSTITPSTATLTPTAKSAATRVVPSRTSAPTALTRKILYSQCDASCTQPADAHLWVANAEGTDATKIIDFGFSASFAPDGSRLAFEHSKGGIYVANSDGSGQIRIVPGTNVGEPDWSHDGKKIAFVERTKSPGLTTPEPGPAPPPACYPGKVCRPFLMLNLSLEPGYALIPPVRSDPLLQQGNVFIEVVAPDGSGRRTVTIGNHPTWSLDDTQIAYDTCVGGTCGIYKINEGGGEPVKVTDDVGSIPHWSRDGKKILYGTDVDGVRQLFVVNVDGTGKKQLTSGKDFRVDGVWSIDGNSIFYRSTEGAVWGLWVMKADGTSPRRILSGIPPVNWGNEKLSVSK